MTRVNRRVLTWSSGRMVVLVVRQHRGYGNKRKFGMNDMKEKKNVQDFEFKMIMRHPCRQTLGESD